MNLAEKIYVVLDEMSYNLCPGGRGGWGYLNDGSNKHRARVSRAAAKSNSSEKGKKAYAAVIKKYGKVPQGDGINIGFTGQKHTPETIALMKLKKIGHGIGQSGSQYGTMWITDGSSNQKIKRGSDIPDGWYAGRKVKRI